MRAQPARTIEETTIDHAWISIARSIMEDGEASTYDGLAMRETHDDDHRCVAEDFGPHRGAIRQSGASRMDASELR